MISILDRYISREVLKTLGGVAIVLYLIFLSNRLVHYLADVASGSLPGSYLFIIIGLASVRYLIILTPLALYISILLLFGKMYRDHEMASLAACGVGTVSLLRPIFIVAVPMAILISILTFYLVPLAADVEFSLLKKFEKNLEFTGISAGKFHVSGNRIIYLEGMSDDRTRMQNVFIRTEYKGRDILMVAEKAHMEVDNNTGERLIVLDNGSRYEGTPGQTDFMQVNFSRHTILFADKKEKARQSDIYSMSNLKLISLGTPEAWAELQWRAAIPLSILLLAFLAVPLSRVQPRQGQFGRLFVGVLIYVLYANLLAISKAWIANGTIPLIAGATWVHVAILSLTLLILVRQYGFSWLRHRFSGG
ncbi:MAG TPA: LPS export ABC transporter permease LptF [Gammaproteobacteria bacterium]|mgnify:CR=1 FL=1|nr:LPS export ABC transporter permease LptF [Gammaproteobacteria bacterium]